MRKPIAFTIATAVVALASLFLAEPAVVGSSADEDLPEVGLALHVMSNPYLPIQVLEEAY